MNEPQSIDDIIAQNQAEPDALPSEPRPITLQDLRGQAPLVGAPPAEVRDLERARRERLKMAVSNTATINPEQAASRQKIAERLGIPSSLVGKDESPLMRQVLAEEVERLRLADTNPKFAQSLTDSQEWAAISSDSLERLNQWTYQLLHSRFAKSSFLPDFIDKAILDTALAFDSGYNRSMANRMAMKDNVLGAYVRPDSDADIIRRPATDVFGNPIKPSKDEKGRMVSAPTLVDRFQRSRLSAPAGDPDNWFVGVMRYTGEQLGQKFASADLYGTAIGGGASAGATIGGSAGGLPGALAGGVKGALYGWRAAAFADGFVNEGASVYLEMRAQGIEPELARAMAMTHGVASGVLEAWAAKIAGIPFEKAASHALKTQARRALTKTTKWMIAREAAFDLLKVNTLEALTEATQAASFELSMDIARRAQDPDRKGKLSTPEGRAEAIGAVMNDFWYTFKYGWLMSSAGPSVNAMTRYMRFQRDVENFERLEGLIEDAKDLKPIDRNPNLAKRVLTTMLRGTDAENLFMDADGVDAFLQQTGLTIEQTDELLPGIADKYAQSRREGNSPFSIPTAEYITRTRGTKFEPALRQQLKVGPDGRSLGQVLALQPMREQMEKEFRDEMARRDTFEKTYARELDDIEERAFAALSGAETRMSSQESRIAAKTLRDHLLTIAAIENVSPAEAERKYPLLIESARRRAASRPPVAEERAKAMKPQLPAAAQAEIAELQSAMEASIEAAPLDAKGKKRLADSARRIFEQARVGDVVALAVEAWRLERRIKSGAATPEAEALLRKLKSILKDLGVEINDPIGEVWVDGLVGVEVVSGKPAKPGQRANEIVQTIAPTVRMNGEIVSRGQVVIAAETEADIEAEGARRAEQEAELRARLERRETDEAGAPPPAEPRERAIGPDVMGAQPAAPAKTEDSVVILGGFRQAQERGEFAGMTRDEAIAAHSEAFDRQQATLQRLASEAPIGTVVTGIDNQPGKDYIKISSGKWMWRQDGKAVAGKPLFDSPFSDTSAPVSGNTVRFAYPQARPAAGPDASNEPPTRRERRETELSQEAMDNTPEWRDWWKDSKAVGPDGKPLILFRGTSGTRDYGDQSKVPTAGLSGGIFVSTDAGYAGSYGNSVIEVVISVQRPLDVSAAPVATLDEWRDILKQAGMEVTGLRFDSSLTQDPLVGEVLPDGRRVYFFYELISKASDYYGNDGNLIAEILRQGFDGVISQPEAITEDEVAPVWIVFESNQIKSVDNMRPTESPNIYEQAAAIDADYMARVNANDMAGAQAVVDDVAMQMGYVGPHRYSGMPDPATPRQFWWAGILETNSSLLDSEARLPQDPANTGAAIIVYEDAGDANDAAVRRSKVNLDARKATREVKVEQGEQVDAGFEPQPYDPVIKNVYIRTVRTLNLDGSNPNRGKQVMDLITEYFTLNPDGLTNSHPTIVRFDWMLEMARQSDPYGWIGNQFRDMFLTYAGKHIEFTKWLATKYDSIIMQTHENSDRVMVIVFSPQQVKDSSPVVRHYSGKWPEYKGIVPVSARFNVTSDILFEQPGNLDRRHYAMWRKGDMKGGQELVDSVAQQTGYGGPYPQDDLTHASPPTTLYWSGTEWHSELPDSPVPYVFFNTWEVAKISADTHADWRHKQAMRRKEWDAAKGEDWELTPERPAVYVDSVYINTGRTLDLRNTGASDEFIRIVREWYDTNPDALPDSAPIRSEAQKMFEARANAGRLQPDPTLREIMKEQELHGWVRTLFNEEVDTTGSLSRHFAKQYDSIVDGLAKWAEDPDYPGEPRFMVYVFDKTRVKRSAPFTMNYNPSANYQTLDGLVPLSARFDISSSNLFEQPAMSTRVPDAKNKIEDALDEILLADYDAFMRDPTFIAKNLAAFDRLGVPVRFKPNMTDAQKVKAIMDQVEDNLLWLHDLMDPVWRVRAMKWYEGAHRLAGWMAMRHGFTISQAAGIYAVLSPQKDWYENASLAHRISDIAMTQRGTVMDKSMADAYIASLIEKRDEAKARLASHKRKSKMPKGQGADKLAKWRSERNARTLAVAKAELDIIQGRKNVADIGTRTLGELLSAREVMLAAIFVRWFDETKNGKSYGTVTPEGGVTGTEKAIDGRDKIVRYGTYLSVAKALSIIIDGSAANIHVQIGSEHKVRNFYNNILNPHDPRFITIDTHAIAASWLLALAGEDDITKHGLGGTVGNSIIGLGGAYALYFEAYKRAAAKRNLIGRQMQSIDWEAIRGMFASAMKKSLKEPIAKIWAEYKAGKITMAQARGQVLAMSGGITAPSWVSIPTTVPPEAGYTGPSRDAADAAAANSMPAKPGYADISFEVRPDPANKKVSRDWDRLPTADRVRISLKIAKNIVDKVLKEYGVTGQLFIQVGGWHDDKTINLPKITRTTDVSFSLRLDDPDKAVAVAKAIGIALSQHGVFVTSDKQFNQSEQGNAIYVDLVPGTTEKDIKELYEVVLAPVLDKYKIEGMSTVDDVMAIILPDNVNPATVEKDLDPVTSADPRIIDIDSDKVWKRYENTRDIYSEAERTGKAGHKGPLFPWRRARELRADATRQLAAELRALNAGRLPQPAIGPAFYSALARAVGSIPSSALPVGEWKNLLAGFVKRGVVKAEEVEWSHIEEFLDMQPEGRVARSTVMDFLRENGVKVSTVTQVSRVDSVNQIAALAADRAEMELGEEGVLTDELRQQIADYKKAVNDPGSTRERLHELKSPIDAALNSTTGIDLDAIMQNLEDEGAVPAAEFEHYAIPGGERYRVRVVTIPSKPVIGATSVRLLGDENRTVKSVASEFKGMLRAAGYERLSRNDEYLDVKMGEFSIVVPGPLTEELKGWIARNNGSFEERVDESATFTSKHFQSVGGYVLHIREQEFVAPDGKRVRVIVEIQSDYAQAVRDLGVRGKPKQKIARVEPIDVAWRTEEFGSQTKKMFAAYDDAGNKIASGETVEDARENARRSLNYKVRNLPDGPFIGNTDSWTTLALKEIMRSAVEDGVDRVAFIRGEMAANWFDITHQIDRLDYYRRSNGRYDIEVRPRGRRGMVGLGNEGTNISRDDVVELVGKELAERIFASEGEQGKGGWMSLTGLSLKVGGKGMEYYYNTIVMKLLEKLVRKYGGDGVKDIQFAARERGPQIDWKELAKEAYRHMRGETSAREFIDDNGLDGLTSESEVEAMLPQSRDPWNPFPKDIAKAYAKLVASRTTGAGKVHTLKGFEFNEAMTERVSQGLPLFQAARGDARGYYDPMRSAIILTSETDLSTVLHELAHHHLETMVKMALSPMASEKVRQNLDTVLSWFGIAGATPEERLAKWNSMSLEEKRPHHESFTYNWEIYLFQGKAPAIELEDSFRHFTIALKRIYRTGIKEINDNYRERFGTDLPAITPEMRYIFDTLLATDEQIQRAEAVREMVPLFKVREDWMTDEDWDEYNRLANAATMESVSELNKDSLSVMQWMSGARMRIVRQMQREHEELRDEVRNEIIQEIDREPLYRAMAYLKTGVSTNPDGSEIQAIGPHRLDMDALESMYPASMANRPDLNKLGTGGYGMMGRDGVHPDFIAERFGYFSGDQLVRALVAARSREDEIAFRTDQTMMDRYSDLNTEQARNEAIERALHTEVRSRMIAAETKMLTKSMQPSRLMVDAAKMAARDILAGKRVRDIRPGAYVAGEAQAARDAQNAYARRLTPSQAGQTAFTRAFNEAVKEGLSEEQATKIAEKARDEAIKVAEARDAEYKSRYGKADPEQVVVRAKRNQLLQNQLAKQSLSALEEVRKKVRYLRKVLTDESRKRMGADAADQIETLLEQYELKALSLKRIDERKALSKWIAEQEALGITPDIPDHIRDNVGLLSYRDMTLAQFRELFDTIKQIEHFGKNRSKLLAAAKRKSFEEARDGIVLNIRENASARGRITKDRSARTTLGRAYQNAGKFVGSHLKAATIVQILDGTIDGGLLWEYLTRPANAAGDAETKMMSEATVAVATILKPLYSAEPMGGKGQFFPSVNEHLNLEARVVIAANYGNASNRQRLLDGFGWSDEDVQPVLQSLTAKQWMVIQEVWNYFESFRPMIAAKERRTKGKEPDWIEPSPFEIETADGQVIQLQGGYYPIVYDPRASTRGGTISEEDMAQRQLQGARIAATTRQSYTKSRVDRVENMPLILDLRGLYRGTNEVIHDLTHHEWLIDANRLLRDDGFASAVRQTLGPESYDQLKQWVADVAAGITGMESGLDVAANWLRQNISQAGLGYSLLGGVIQPTGVNQSITRIGAKWFGLGLARVISDPIGAVREATDNSEFMANRGRTQFRELNEVANMVRGQSMANRRYKLGVFLPIIWMQRLVDVPTWHGARLRALDSGADFATATARADQAVIDSQGSGLIKDLSRVERGGALLKLFTVFYSYMNTPYNMAALKAMTNKSKGKTVADLLMIFTAPVILTHALKSMLRPNAEDEEFDLEALARALAAEQLEYLMGTMVLVREFAYAAKIATGAEGTGRGYGGPAGLRMISDTGVFLTQLKQGEFDTPFRKAAVNLLGSTAGLPSVQINRTWDGIQAIAEGEIDNPVDAIRAILFGIER